MGQGKLFLPDTIPHCTLQAVVLRSGRKGEVFIQSVECWGKEFSSEWDKKGNSKSFAFSQFGPGLKAIQNEKKQARGLKPTD